LSDYLARLRRERPARAARRKPARKGFATLRVAKKKCFGLGLGSSTSKARIPPRRDNQSFFLSPLAKGKAIIFNILTAK